MIVAENWEADEKIVRQIKVTGSLIGKMALANSLPFPLQKLRPYCAHNLAPCLRFHEIPGAFVWERSCTHYVGSCLSLWSPLCLLFGHSSPELLLGALRPGLGPRDVPCRCRQLREARSVPEFIHSAKKPPGENKTKQNCRHISSGV